MPVLGDVALLAEARLHPCTSTPAVGVWTYPLPDDGIDLARSDGNEKMSGSQTSSLLRHLTDALTDAHDDWLEECLRVGHSYSLWSSASMADRAVRFAAYASALDREEAAANRYRTAARRLESTRAEMLPLACHDPARP